MSSTADDAHDAPHALAEIADGVLTITLNRPRKLNAVSEAMTGALWDATHRFRDDDALAVMLVRAVGRYFSAGIDLDSRTGRGQEVLRDEAHAGSRYRRRYREHHRLYDEWETIEKPIVVAYHGPVIGAGLELGLSCDFRLAARSATFRLPEVTMGTIAGSGGVSRLTRLVGPGWARWLAMAGRPVDADRALTMGLVQEVWDDDAFDGEVRNFVAGLAGLPREAVGLSKVVIDASTSVDAGSARHVERLANSRLTFEPPHYERFVDPATRDRP